MSQPNSVPSPAPAAGEAAIDRLNSLLRGEISAAETYRMAIDRVAASDSQAHAALLREIQEELWPGGAGRPRSDS
jgi:hypothetical protein